jgi:hypothetical protein
LPRYLDLGGVDRLIPIRAALSSSQRAATGATSRRS